MAYRTLEITLVSAKDLKDVNIFSKMEVYAVAMIVGDPRSKQRTPADKEGGKNPSWNSTIRFSIPANDSAAAGLVLQILLRSERALGDRDVGEVHVPVKELLDGKPGQSVSYQVRKPESGKAKGVLNLSFKFGDIVAAPAAPKKPTMAGDPVTAYPAAAAAYPPQGKAQKGSDPVTAFPASASASAAYPPPGAAAPYPPPGGYPPQHGYGAPPPPEGYGYPPPQSGYGYPPQQQGGYGYPPPQQGGYGYPPPQQGGYGYPPQQGGYGYPPAAVAQPAKKNKFGMGLGAGLLGGALGGLLIGDMVSDSGGYDGGFGDGGMDF